MRVALPDDERTGIKAGEDGQARTDANLGRSMDAPIGTLLTPSRIGDQFLCRGAVATINFDVYLEDSR